MARCHGYTHLISFQRGLDTTEWPSHLRRSGYGASTLLIHPLANIYELTTIFCRLCCFKSDAYYSHQARLQDVLDVCVSERWGDGSIRTVCVTPLLVMELMTIFCSMIPETKGRSLEEMDIVFGAVSADNRAANIAQHVHGAYFFYP